jgi:hypothetical protein
MLREVLVESPRTTAMMYTIMNAPIIFSG